MGPVQSPSGSGTVIRESAWLATAARTASRTVAPFSRRMEPGPSSVAEGRRSEALLPPGSCAVDDDDLERTIAPRNEGKSEHRIRRDRDVAVDREHVPISDRYRDLLDIAGRRVVPRNLVHLHAVEVRMADHQRRPDRPIRRRRARELHLHVAHALHRLLIAYAHGGGA